MKNFPTYKIRIKEYDGPLRKVIEEYSKDFQERLWRRLFGWFMDAGIGQDSTDANSSDIT